MECTCLSPDRCGQGSENEIMYVHMCVHKYVSVNCVQECFIVYGITCVCVLCVCTCVCVCACVCACPCACACVCVCLNYAMHLVDCLYTFH